MTALLPETLLFFCQDHLLTVYRLGGGLWSKLKVKEEREYELAGLAALPDVLRQIKQEYQPKSDDTILLGLPLKFFNVVHCHLPLAAVDNLDEAVRYELVRHLPYDLSKVHLHYVSRTEDDGLEITATVVPEVPVDHLLTAFGSAGLVLSTIFPALFFLAWLRAEEGLYLAGGRQTLEVVASDGSEIIYHAWERGPAIETGKTFLQQSRQMLENLPVPPRSFWLWQGEVPVAVMAEWLAPLEGSQYPLELPRIGDRPFADFPYQVNLVPPKLLKRRKLMFWLQAASVLFFLLALLSLPLADLGGKRTRLKNLEHSLTEIRQHADQLNELRRKNQAMIDYFQGVARYVKKQPVAVNLLKEMTELFPADAWLESMEISGQQIHLRGSSTSATTVLEALENSPLFKEVAFDSPVVKRGPVETFKIVASLE
ncbi:MAG: PilN domain-containing protein [Deltaproteobacteria bacterium]|nr:PilN domain-containing protein [Candidatus Anaeroferrophillus wilburensis]MBN2888364.1 PilN domain-containing protein [Deltaproteobacteria bacterium]